MINEDNNFQIDDYILAIEDCRLVIYDTFTNSELIRVPFDNIRLENLIQWLNKKQDYGNIK